MKTEYSNCPLCGGDLSYREEFPTIKSECKTNVDLYGDKLHHFYIYSNEVFMIIKPFMIVNYDNISTIYQLSESSYYVPPNLIVRLSTLIEPSSKLTVEKIKKYILLS